MTAITSAIVIGGGIAGLTAARALALRGVRVTLAEKKPRILDEGGIGIGIQSNAMNAFGEIGLAEAIVAEGVPVGMLHTHAPDGTLIRSIPTDRWCNSPWPGFTGIARPAIHEILVRGAAEAGVELLTGAEVASVTDGAEAVTVTLTDGRSLSADLAIAADGIRSPVRALLFPNHARPQPTSEVVWRGLVPGLRLDEVRFVFGGGVGTVGYTPLKHDLYLYIVDRDDREPPRDAPDMAERMAALVSHLPGWPSDFAARLSRAPGDATYRRLEAVQLPAPWYRGRTLLIGDAAHAGPPTLAQGAAMGIEDGVVLAQCLAGAMDLEGALAAFMARRYERVRTIVEASLTLSRAQMQPGGQAEMGAAMGRAAAALAQPY